MGAVGAPVLRIRVGETPPPVLRDGADRSTMDGLHRLNAPARRGIAQVVVRVGVEDIREAPFSP